MYRRTLLKGSLAAAAAPLLLRPATAVADQPGDDVRSKVTLKLGLNAFTFNKALESGEITRNDVVDFCSREKIDGLDMTGYYFSQYPEVPDDRTIYEFKRYAFENGVTISGTGVRNNFSVIDKQQLDQEIEMVKGWVVATAKMGADVLRVFSGRPVADPELRKTTFDSMVEAFKQCTLWAADHGVILGLQHHHDFLKTADQTIDVVNAVDDRWFRVVLDVGSLRDQNVYQEIEKLLPYAATWQLKEQVWIDDQQVPIDLARVKSIIQKIGYRGFLPFELLGGYTDIDTRYQQAKKFGAAINDTIIG